MNDESTQLQTNGSHDDPAVALIRGKLTALYEHEPNAKAEEAEVESMGAHSKHQRFMAELMQSGQDFASIQTAWHNYYLALPENEKHEVWQEFYSNQARQSKFLSVTVAPEKEKKLLTRHKREIKRLERDTKPQSVAEIKQKLASKISADGKLSARHHLKSLFFGLSLTAFFALIVMFGLFNQLVIAPFITPSKSASATPVIVDPNNPASVGPDAKIIIPKINVEAPLILDAANNDEKTIQAALEKGVTLYPNTGKPGEQANPILFGHSSNNLFNSGAYKFVFVLLSRLEEGDTFMVNYEGKQYVYRVFSTRVVKPNEVGVLGEMPKESMMTLITCDPPGTSTNRLIVQGEQISPDPSANKIASAETIESPSVIPGNAESLWHRIWNAIF